MSERQWAAQKKFVDNAIQLHQASVAIAEEAAMDITPDSYNEAINSNASVCSESDALLSTTIQSRSSANSSESPSKHFIASDITNLPPPAKKRRISQDQRIALFGHEDLIRIHKKRCD